MQQCKSLLHNVFNNNNQTNTSKMKSLLKRDKNETLQDLKTYLMQGGTIAGFCENSDGQLKAETVSEWINQDADFQKWLITFETTFGKMFVTPASHLQYYYMRGKLK